MNKIFLLGLIFALGVTGCSLTPKLTSIPYLSAEEVEILAENYIQKEHPKIQIEKYILYSLTFDYKNSKWSLLYFCKKEYEDGAGCSYSVSMSDSKPTKFIFWGGV
ncbi:hypothetical protein GARC_0202 [Paraglaciecola arctica BSs20135]|uniref:Lipoprotein n=2 Tax=Paraglaciecola TaxID=1621534 RepID=K6X977_9ALTE|nr:hypothetical protein GARC_0202 [Paraglaciecola arctica BSs20135]